MKPKYFLFLSPLLIFIEAYVFSWITELLRQPSDSAVIAGVVLFSLFIIANYFLFNYITTTIKKNKTK